MKENLNVINHLQIMDKMKDETKISKIKIKTSFMCILSCLIGKCV